MGKTADLTVVQKTTIDTLHKEGKTQKVIAKEAGCSQSSVSKHINREAKGRKRCGRKKCTSNRDKPHPGEDCETKPIQKCGEIHKEWTAAGGQCFKNHYAETYARHGFQLSHSLCQATLEQTDSVRSVSPGLKTKRTGLLLSGPKLCSLMKVNFAFPLEIRVPESGGREERHRIHVA